MKKTSSANLALALGLLFSLLFASCEYDNTNKNYFEVEKPKPIQLAIDLAGVDPTQVIQVPNNTSIQYTMSAEGKQFVLQEFYWDGKPVMTNTDPSGSNVLYIGLDKVDNLVHELMIKSTIKSGSGSLADHLNLEHYIGETTFRIKVVDTNSSSLNIKQSTDAEGHLKLTWDTPKDMDIYEYEIFEDSYIYPTTPIATVAENNREFVDKSYSYGYKKYIIRPKLLNSPENGLYDLDDTHTVEYETMTSDNFSLKLLPNNQIELSWNNPNPFPARFIVLDNRDNVVAEITDGSNKFIYDLASFPDYGHDFDVRISASYNTEYDSQLFYLGNFQFSDPTTPHSIDYFYHPNKPLFYTINFDGMRIYDVNNNFKQTKFSKIVPEIYSTGSKIKVSEGGLIVIENRDALTVYADDDLNKLMATISDIGYYNQYSVGGNFLLVHSNDFYNSGKYITKVYNLLSNTQIINIELLNSNNSNSVTSHISPNGKYFVIVDNANGKVVLYQIVNNQEVLAHTWSNIVTQDVVFNAYNENEIIFVLNNKIQVVDLNTFSDKAQITGNYLALDPITGNILYYTDNKGSVSIMSKDYKTILAPQIQIQEDYTTETSLYNNLLLTSYNHGGTQYYRDYRDLINK